MRKKHRRARPKKPLPEFVQYDSPSKTPSEDTSSTLTSYKSFSTQPSFVGTKTDSDQYTLAPEQPPAPAGAGTGAQAKEKSAPVYGNALTWKSDQIKLEEEYARVRRNVNAMAPEQFADRAKPTGQPADIVPRSLRDYNMFKSENISDRMKELAADMANMEVKSEANKNMDKDGVPREKRVPKSYFGPGGKALKDATRGPVLAQPTIWSQQWLDSDAPKAPWPTQAELRENGDSRENNQVPHRSGRHLPVPRYPQDPNQPYVSAKDRAAIPQYPLDQTGPIYRDGSGAPAGPTPAKIDAANEEMNKDPEFEAKGLALVGYDLMGAMGISKKPGRPMGKFARAMREVPGGPTGAMERSIASAAKAQPPTTPSYGGQQSTMSSGPVPESFGIQQGQDPAPRHLSFASSESSAIDMTGWVFIGRQMIAGTNIGENFWRTPWGETVVFRDDY